MIVYFVAHDRSRVRCGFEHNLYKYGTTPETTVLGHERLRPLPGRRAAGSRRTGRRRGAAAAWSPRCSGRAAPAQSWRERAAARQRAALPRTRRRIVLALALLGFAGARRRASSTTPTCSTTIARERRATRQRPTTRSSMRSTRTWPQPRITDVQTDVDIYPEQRAARDPRALHLGQQDSRTDPRPARPLPTATSTVALSWISHRAAP